MTANETRQINFLQGFILMWNNCNEQDFYLGIIV